MFSSKKTPFATEDQVSKAIFKIGDFSQLAQVSIRTLRHYDELSLLKPMHVDELTDYRYYSIEQLPQLHRIVALKDMGFSLKEIKELTVDDVSANDLKAMLEQKQNEVSQKILMEQQRLTRIEARLKQIKAEHAQPQHEVTLKRVAAMTIFSKRFRIPHLKDMDEYCARLYIELYEVLNAQDLVPIAPEFTLFHTDGFELENIDIEVCVVLDGKSLDRLELPSDESYTVRRLQGSKTMASVVYHGYFQELSKAAEAIVLWAGNNGYYTAGAGREVHLSGPIVETGKDRALVIEMQAPLLKH